MLCFGECGMNKIAIRKNHESCWLRNSLGNLARASAIVHSIKLNGRSNQSITFNLYLELEEITEKRRRDGKDCRFLLV